MSCNRFAIEGERLVTDVLIDRANKQLCAIRDFALIRCEPQNVTAITTPLVQPRSGDR
jgi:hypothetical protein